MTRQQILDMCTHDGLRYGHIRNETQELARSVRVSGDSMKRALWKGSSLRDEVYRKHSFWEIDAAERKIRDKIKRALSCGDDLTEPENVELIAKLGKAKALVRETLEKVQKEIEDLSL